MTARADYGSTDRHRHDVVRPELTGHGHAVRMRVKDGCEIDRLQLRGLINPFQHSAAASFARDLHAARLLGVATVNLGGTGGGQGGSITDGQADALIKVGDAIRVLDRLVGQSVRVLTVDLCLSLVRVERAETLRDAKQGLDALLSHYDRRHQTVFTLQTDLVAGPAE